MPEGFGDEKSSLFVDAKRDRIRQQWLGGEEFDVETCGDLHTLNRRGPRVGSLGYGRIINLTGAWFSCGEEVRVCRNEQNSEYQTGKLMHGGYVKIFQVVDRDSDQ